MGQQSGVGDRVLDGEHGERGELARLRQVLATAPDMYVSVDADGLVLDWNEAGTALLGWTAAQVLGQSIAAAVLPSPYWGLLGRFADPAGACRADPPVELQLLHRDGHPVPVLMTIRPATRDTPGHAFVRPLPASAGDGASGGGGGDATGRMVRAQAAELERERAFLRAVLANLSDAVVACDGDGALTVFNPAAERLHGLPAEPLPPERWAGRYDLYTAGGRPMPVRDVPLFRALRGEEVTGERMLIAPEGQPVRTVLATGQRISDSAGRTIGAVVSMRDVSDAVAAQEALARREAQTRAAFDASPVAMAIIDGQDRLVRVNPAMCGMLGEPAEDLVGAARPELTRRDEVERRFVRADGSAVWAVVTFTGMRDPTGARQRLAQAQDVTARRSAEVSAARQTRLLLSTIEAQRAVTAAVRDRAEVLRVVADRAVTAFPAADGAVVELLDGDLLRYEAAAGILVPHIGVRLPVDGSLSGVAMAGRQAVRCADTEADPRVNRDACRRTGIRSMCIAPLLSGDAPIGVLKVSSAQSDAFDADDARQLELLAGSLSAALRHAEDFERNAELLAERTATLERLGQQARLLHLIPTAVIVRDYDGTIRWWNHGAESTYGHVATAALGRRTDDLLATGYQTGVNAMEIGAALRAEGSWSGEVTHRNADGRTLIMLSRQVLQRSADGRPTAVLEVNTDITAQRAAEQARTASEQRLRAQFVHSAAGQVIRALDGTWLEVNPAFAAMLGTTPGELLGVNVNDLLHPNDLPASIAGVDALAAGAVESVESEGRMRRFDGDWLDYHSTISAVRDPDGRPQYLVVVITDITSRRVAERARDEASALLAERNTQLEEANQLKLDLIGMLGHEIGNPLASILGYAEIASDPDEPLSDAGMRRCLTSITMSARRLDGIVREVLAMVAADAGTLTARPETVDVARHLDAALQHAPAAPGAVIGCATGLHARCQPAHLELMLVNLLSNATKYGGGATAVRAGARAGGVEIHVEDRGPGVPASFQDRLFERFARAEHTAGTVKGTGLGLHIVRELARANGGDVRYEPHPGGGSVFVLSLPTA